MFPISGVSVYRIAFLFSFALSFAQVVSPNYPLCNLTSAAPKGVDVEQQWNSVLSSIPKYGLYLHTHYKQVDFGDVDAVYPSRPGVWSGAWKKFSASARKAPPGWVSDQIWPVSASTNYTVYPNTTNTVVALGRSISIMGFDASSITIAPNGIVGLGSMTGSSVTGIPTLEPFGNLLVPSNSLIRYGWVNTNGRAADNQQVFVVEFKDYRIGSTTGLPISVQVLIWPSDGLVQFHYWTNHSQLAAYRNLNPFIGYRRGSQVFTLNTTSVFQIDANGTEIWNNGTMRPGWVAWDPSANTDAVGQPGHALIGSVDGGVTKTLDFVFCDEEANQMVTWDWSRDLFVTSTHPSLNVEYTSSLSPSANFQPTGWAFDEYRIAAKSYEFLNTKTMITEGCKQQSCSQTFFTSQDYPGPNGTTQQKLLGLPEMTVTAAKFTGINNLRDEYDNKLHSGITLALPGIISFKSIKLLHNEVNSVEIMGSADELNPLGLKPYITRNGTEGVQIPSLAPSLLFEKTPASVADYDFFVESVSAADGSAVPVSVSVRSAGIVFTTTDINYHGSFTVNMKVVKKSTQVSGYVPIIVNVESVNDAPIIYQGEQAGQLPYRIGMYGQQESDPINLADPRLVWDDDLPLASVAWNIQNQSANKGLGLSYSNLNSVRDLNVFFLPDAAATGEWSLSLQASDGKLSSPQKILDIQRFSSTLELVEGSAKISQRKPTGQVVGTFKVRMPATHDALTLDEALIGYVYTTFDLRILDNSGLEIGTCQSINDGLRVECPVTFRFDRNANVEATNTGVVATR